MNIRCLPLSILFFLALFSSLSHSATYYDQPITGQIKDIEINSSFTSARNIIVELKDASGTLRFCGNSATSGYINKSDNPDTFSAILSILISAKATKSTVTILTADGTEGCRIDRVRFN